MYASTVFKVLELFRDSSAGCEIHLGLTSMPSRTKNSGSPVRNFLYVVMKDRAVTVQIYENVPELLKGKEVEEILKTPFGIGLHFDAGERLELPFDYFIFSYCKKIVYMRNSDNILKEESLVVHNSTVSINHTVQLLEILFRLFGNKMQFTMVSKKFPDKLCIINYINGNAYFLDYDKSSVVLYKVNLFRFKEFFGDYRILQVDKSNLPVEYAQFVSERSALAHRLGLEFREVEIC